MRHVDPLDAAADYQQRMNDEAVARHAGRARLQQKIIRNVVVCLHCPRQVEAERLIAVPDAALCIRCARELEG